VLCVFLLSIALSAVLSLLSNRALDGAGLLVAFAVMFKRREMNILFVVVTVAAFVILGFDHCIANMFYYGVFAVNGGAIRFSAALDLLAATLGNMIGGGIAAFLEPRG